LPSFNRYWPFGLTPKRDTLAVNLPDQPPGQHAFTLKIQSLPVA